MENQVTKLKQFLIEHNAKEKFIKYFKKGELFRFIKRNYKHPILFINAGFIWAGTDEGNLYWVSLSKQWEIKILSDEKEKEG